MIPGFGTAIITIFEWAWKNFGKDIVKCSAKHLTTSWQTFEFKRAAEKYANSMKKH